jgi:hypothetical protein
MVRKEYMRIAIASIPQSMNGFVLVAISHGMYGLPQAGILAYNQLVTHLAQYGYAPCTHTPGLWTHETRDVTFCLFVDNFGIKYTNRSDAEHLLTALQALYVVTTDWTASLYLAMTIDWDYHNHTVDISIPGYVTRALDRFQHNACGRAQHSPHDWTKPQYGFHPQLTPAPDDTDLLQPSPESRKSLEPFYSMVAP